MGSPNQTLEKCRRFVQVSKQVITNMGMVEIPVQRLSEEEQQILRQEAEIERIRQRRLRESQQSDQMWPRCKRSDLMAHMMFVTRQYRAVPKEPAPTPVLVPVKKMSAKTPVQDNMWPRRRKSDPYVYQEVRQAPGRSA